MLVNSPGDSDYDRAFAYLRWLTGLPWNARDEARIDLRRTRQLLDERHSGLATAKERILEYLAARKLGGGAKGRILCFISPSRSSERRVMMAVLLPDGLGVRQRRDPACPLRTSSPSSTSRERSVPFRNRRWTKPRPQGYLLMAHVPVKFQGRNSHAIHTSLHRHVCRGPHRLRRARRGQREQLRTGAHRIPQQRHAVLQCGWRVSSSDRSSGRHEHEQRLGRERFARPGGAYSRSRGGGPCGFTR